MVCYNLIHHLNRTGVQKAAGSFCSGRCCGCGAGHTGTVWQGRTTAGATTWCGASALAGQDPIAAKTDSTLEMKAGELQGNAAASKN